MVKKPQLLKRLEVRLVRAVWRWQRREARRRGVTAPLRGGAVVFTQWFGSMLQLTPHLHVVVPEAQWTPKRPGATSFSGEAATLHTAHRPQQRRVRAEEYTLHRGRGAAAGTGDVGGAEGLRRRLAARVRLGTAAGEAGSQCVPALWRRAVRLLRGDVRGL